MHLVREHTLTPSNSTLLLPHSDNTPLVPREMTIDCISTSRDVRRQARSGFLTGSTSGLATTMQCNLLVLPSKYARDFLDLCIRNPVPCPLLDRTSVGGYSTILAEGADLRTDIPAYNVYKNGELVSSGISNVKDLWTDDHVGFLIGCSYSFETALSAHGLTPRSMRGGKLMVPMFVTTLPLCPAGVFTSGTWVVSMRSYKPSEIDEVRKITGRYRRQHGEPIAWGWEGAERLGIKEKLENGQVDFGDVCKVPDDEIPVFWGCGVTPQIAVMMSKLDGVILSHKPGCMFVTDLLPDEEESLASVV